MAPSRQPAPPFVKDERVLCFHHEMLYEAKILDIQPADSGEGHKYKIHYKGWKNTWDDWVPLDRIRKFTDENKELAAQLQAQVKNLSQKGSQKPKKGRANGTESARGSEERVGGTSAQPGRGPRRARDFELETEEAFQARPSMNFPVSDHIKALLVDDWENITKNNQLVPLPHPHPVDKVLNDYLAFEHPNREEGSASRDILDETIAGFREYFDKALSRILLYRFERPQYHEIRRMWEKENAGGHKGPTDTYGAEHLARLLVSLPELVTQTNLDQQSASRLREEMNKFTRWLSNHSQDYFLPDYETPSQEYIDKAKSF